MTEVVYNRPAGDHSIQPASGYYGINWPSTSGVIPQSFSMGGWTSGNLGYVQQTFLGASIRSFNLNGGFGDTSSQLSVELINDEFNVSDKKSKGEGDDVYHNGTYDTFAPPPVGSPVFFKFGSNYATVAEAYKKTFDDLYNTSTFSNIQPKVVGNYDKNNFVELQNGQYIDIQNGKILDNSEFLNSKYRGKDHLTFGGILQSYVQNRGPAGNPLYSVQVVDPREILSNAIIVLNNYAGTTHKNPNMFNIYGFLEYDPTETLQSQLESFYPNKNVLTKYVNSSGIYSYSGYDIRGINGVDIFSSSGNYDFTIGGASYNFLQNYPVRMPITGTGFSRRGNQGIPYYRLRQGLNALLGIDGLLPQEYTDAGFGSYINFRGFNYLVDLGGLKKISDYYFFDFDQMNLLDLCLEICDITSSDLFVTLLPIIEHPVSQRFYDYNKTKMKENKPKEIIAGIIRVDAIDRSKQPEYGAIKKYIDSLASSGIFVENQDVGFELSNVTTDKFIVGAQEVDMYYFSGNADRDELEIRKQKAGYSNSADFLVGEQWKLETSLKQQIIPYYGLLGSNGNKAVTIPKGFGAYQQILLDTTGLNANGVGNYYVATEMELRAALVSYTRWKDFLVLYNDLYMESIEDNDALEQSALAQTAAPPAGAPNVVQVKPNISNNYAVTVPRSVFDTDKEVPYGDDDLPSSPCNPPYGYPLYYKRATKIGISEAGLAGLQGSYNTILTNLAALQNASDDDFPILLRSQWTAYTEGTGPNGVQSDEEKQFYDWIKSLIDSGKKKSEVIGLIENTLTGLARSFKILNRLSKKTTENSLRVYNFIKQIADECFGRKFLIRIPNEVNLWYSSNINLENDDININAYSQGPFGFRPRSINYDPNYEYGNVFKQLIRSEREKNGNPSHFITSFLTKLDNVGYSKFKGALHTNWNPIAEKYEFNYEPNKDGGFINFDLYENVSNSKSLGVSQGLIPQDAKNFINDQNRMSAYVRFDNSQYLSFDGFNHDSFTQQRVESGDFIPDITYELDNTRTDDFISLPKNKDEEDTPLPKTVAFVKCDVDDKLYMPPKTEIKRIIVHGRQVKDIGQYSKPNKIYDCATNDYKNSFSYYKANYIPIRTTGEYRSNVLSFKTIFNPLLNGNIIDTEEKNLDTDHVYALITLQSRVLPTKDARFRDSTFQQANADRFKHLLALDVVKGLNGFDEPTFVGRVTNAIDGIPVNQQASDAALLAYNAAMKGVEFTLTQVTSVSQPSPIYPDLVALPLMSKERCYGPWVSSQIDTQAKVYQNVAGKVEFIKDENLAPWNYNGYQLMNAAGILQAEFSNSLLLQTERGGFVVPSAPFGVTLGKALLNSGPLVTNISVDVSENGIKTTYKMDLYTAKFGKLQKQKQDLVSKISRERQKLQDERNSLIRKGLGKNATRVNYQQVYKELGNLQKMTSGDGLNDIFNGNDPNNMIVGNVNPQTNTGITGLSVADGPNSTNEFTYTLYPIKTSFQSPNNLSYIASFKANNIQLAQEMYNTAGQDLADMYSPALLDIAPHKNMPSLENRNSDAIASIYFDFDKINNDDITIG
jgi:hypothetical protein